MESKENNKINIQDAFVTMDTDYIPDSNTPYELERQPEFIKYLLVEVPVADDTYVAVIGDTEDNIKMIRESNMNIIGQGETCVSLGSLIYGLNHPTRVSYKSSCGALKEAVNKLYSVDDDNLRMLFKAVK